MKTKLLIIGFSIIYGYFFNQINAQTTPSTVDFSFESLQVPNLKGSQTTKALVTISPDGKETSFLTRVATGLKIVENENKSEIKKNQLWWVVQDFKHQAFALVSVENGADWIYLQETNVSFSIVLATNDIVENEYIDDNYFFEFVMPYNTQEDKHYIIQSAAKANNYLKAVAENISLESLQTEDTTPFTFEFNTFKSFENQYIIMPTYSSNAHTIENIAVADSDNRFTRITADDFLAPIEDNTAIIGSGNITTLIEGGTEDMFQVVFNDKAAAKLGLLDYNVSVYSKEALQSPGSRLLTSGIEKRDNGIIYIFNKGKEIATEFVPNLPIYFGHESGKLLAKQGDKKYVLKGVPTPILLNSDNGNFNRFLAIVRRGSIDISYKPQAILVSGTDFGTVNAPEEHTTDPQFSFAPSGRPTNTFDWRQEYYSMAYDAAGIRTAVNVKSPFYSNELNLRPISSKFSVDGTYQGGEDFSSIDGWEFVQMDFGYDKLGNQKNELRGEPYFVLYNRFTGKLRVFLYVYNGTIANFLKVSISDKQTATYSGQYHQPRLWASYLQGKALDNPFLGAPEYSKYIELSGTNKGKFYYVDFTFNYDPCTCFFESNLQIKVDKVTRGTMEIVGKTLGGSIPAGADGYDAWMEKSDSFLTGVLDAPFGEQSQSLGDISLTSLNEWNNTPWSNETEFTIPGRKVQDWEREALRLQYVGTTIMSVGDYTSAAGKVVKASGKAFPDTFGDPVEALGEGLDALGTAIKGGGRGMTANAVKLRLDNLEDEPDKVIPLQFPDPQPSLVFAELAAKGSLTIESNIFKDVVITTPGSENAEYAPIEAGNGTKGAFPYYNESLGVFNLVYTPKIAVAIVKNAQDRFGGHIRIKEKPYVTTNMDKVQGTEYGFFMANYVITTYNKEGYSMNSVRTNSFLIGSSKNADNPIPTTLDITDLLDEYTLEENMGAETISASNFKNWISVTLEIDYMGLSGVGESGQQNSELVRQSYDAITEFSYDEVSVDVADLNQTAEEKANENFAVSYPGVDNPIWGENYIITKNTEGFEGKMGDFCRNSVPFVNKAKRSSVINKRTHKAITTVVHKEEDIINNLEDVTVSAYPNPSNSIFNINYKTFAKGEILFSVTDLNGRIILSHKDMATDVGESKEARIDLQNLEGIYMLNIQFENGKNHTIKLVKKNY
ncbi:T9SS type A sorting domain-containing protein [Tenacibaculum sp. M341]|uniref:T9SS type A sorting domain-containing protein n=1 Tax=Tenacibaculum sp. M341 TaxID=2530339 RepID=UPI0010501E09|nr:T9SS type A sorting domain-containing protein [Tenacibaculum sp. M341]TCI92129.1 T9SS type A sorting domain-containing protein [Tenacibaculum sp. M341]